MFMPCTRVNLSGLSSGKHQLFGQAQAVVAVAVEGVGVQAAEVADARQGQRNQPVQELVHPRPAERHLAADVHALAQAEGGDALAALQRTGFWPVISARAAVASSMCFLSVIALPTPMLTTIFSSRGSESRFVAAELLCQAAATICSSYSVCNRGVGGGAVPSASAFSFFLAMVQLAHGAIA